MSLCITKNSLSETLLNALKESLITEILGNREVQGYQIVSLSIIHSEGLSGGFGYSDQVDFLSTEENPTQAYYTELINES
jgi:hypothetical protein